MTRLASLALLAAPLAAGAQSAGKVSRVVVIHTISPLDEVDGANPADPGARAFAHGVRDLGYVEGKTLALENLTAQGRPERYADLVAEAVRRQADWGGGGTYFWVDPREDLFVVFMMQSPKQRVPYRYVLEAMVYSAIAKPTGK